MEILFYVALLLFSGLIFARVFNYFKFPDVTGFLLAGILVGPSVLGLVSVEGVAKLQLVSEIALAFIAFSIGSELDLNNLKEYGSKIIMVTLAEAIGAFLVVTFLCLWVFKTSLAFALVLGSISCATAPAATLMVIRQYQAKGDLVEVLIPVVALDDAACIILFGICSSMAESLTSSEALNLVSMFVTPVLEIVLAILLGGVLGLVYLVLVQRTRNEGESLALLLVLIFGATALSLKLGLSNLLLLMASGLLITNLGHNTGRYTRQVDQITPPIFLLFFVISGADLNLGALSSVGLLGIFYVLGRVLGKVAGSYMATRALGFPKTVQKNLGLTLVPQAGVAIGLSAAALQIFPGETGQTIRTVILGATIIYELVGPLVAKFALKRAGNIESHI
ncbi:MAG: cation:proton antiporter [Tissierellia bacterium]|nr:cation:proton antiporter [Tissierellia bacterium]